MNQSLLHDVFDFIKESEKPISKREISNAFNIKGKYKIILKSVLKQLMAEKKIVKWNAKFSIAKKDDFKSAKKSKIERPTDNIIGLVEEEGDQKWLIPSDRRLRVRIPIIKNSAENVKNGHIVRAKINKEGRLNSAEIKSILGYSSDKGVFSDIAIHDFNIKDKFSEKSIVQAESAKLPLLNDREDRSFIAR